MDMGLSVVGDTLTLPLTIPAAFTKSDENVPSANETRADLPAANTVLN